MPCQPFLLLRRRSCCCLDKQLLTYRKHGKVWEAAHKNPCTLPTEIVVVDVEILQLGKMIGDDSSTNQRQIVTIFVMKELYRLRES